MSKMRTKMGEYAYKDENMRIKWEKKRWMKDKMKEKEWNKMRIRHR